MEKQCPPRLRVAVAHGAIGNLAPQRLRYGQQVELVAGPIDTPKELRELATGADAVIVSLQPLLAPHIEALPSSIRAIGRAGVGLDTIDLVAAAARGLPVIYQPSYATAEVADHTMALLLSTTRRILAAHNEIEVGRWPTGPQVGAIAPLGESTGAIVGLGRIGRAVARRLAPFVERLIGWDVQDPRIDGVTYIDNLEELLALADLVSLHVPLNAQTAQLIGPRQLAAMRTTAVLVNASRGGLIDETALAAALHVGSIRAAALDAFANEPLPSDSPLRSAPNLTLTPHMAWYSETSAPRLADHTISDVLSYLERGFVEHGSFAPTPQ